MKKFVYGSLVAAAVVFSGCGGGGGSDNSSGTTPDTEKPVITTSATEYNVTDGTTRVGTITATDNVGVTGFEVTSAPAGTFTISTNGVLSFVAAPTYDASNPANDDYNATVTAKDAAGNESTPKTFVIHVVAAPQGGGQGGGSVPAGVKNINGTWFTIVKPNETNASRENTESDGYVNYNTAQTICNNLSLGGYTDWTLPDFVTLEKLVVNKGDYANDSLNQEVASNVKTPDGNVSMLWSTTPDDNNASRQKNLYTGYTDKDYNPTAPTQGAYWTCVRTPSSN